MGEDIRCRPVSGRVHEVIHEKEWYRVGDNPSSLEKRDGVFFTHFYISIKKIDARDVQGIKFRRTRNMMNYKKYVRQYFMPPVKCMKWAEKEYVEKAPIWCSVDLRDGNQALVIPMSLEQKIEFFKLLVKIGFKEIEVGFPAASETEYEFLRALIEQNLIPEDVTIQVLTQAREHIIRKTFEAVKGAPRAIIHVYNSTSLSQREQVFRKSKEEIRKIAVDGAALLKKLADETDGNFLFEYSPESFTGTEPEYALEVCNAVLDVWKPTPDQKAIINLPVTVEHSMPHVYASQVEYMCDNLKYRENVIVSLHPHNDRGCGVADSELGLLAGADRIEGTLFGNGERTGNVDIITLAMNMYAQGVNPELDFSDMPGICEKYEKFTVGKLDARDYIEKNMILLGISRTLFTHSLPLVVAEQCYMKLLKDARCLIQDTKIAAKREKAYSMLLTLLEDYNIRLLATKVYWDNPKEREQFKRFHEKYKDIQKLKDIDFIEYVKEKEILFIKEDIKNIKGEKTDYSRLVKYYKRKLVDYGVMKEIRDYRTQDGKFIKNKVSTIINEYASA